jgi:uncharacterized protein involved in response to NO
MPSSMQIFFSYGFRSFFVSAAFFAALSILVWVGDFAGIIHANGELDAMSWHAHEMLFGYLAAVLAGFTLTAVANWTGRPPVSGAPLMFLFSIWLAGRLSMVLALAEVLPLHYAALIDVAFIPAFVFLFGREVIAGGNKRNLVVVAAASLFGIANILFCLNVLELFENDLWSRLGLGIAGLLIALIGGRIIPAFTGNWLKAHDRPTGMPEMGMIDKFALLLTGVGALGWTFFPYSLTTAALLSIAGLALLVRLSRWSGHKTFAEPLIVFLHLGYAFLGLSLLAIGLGIWRADLVPPSSGLHLLTAGTIGLMTFVVMTRALLGHTGRPLVTSPAIASALMLIAFGAVVRALAPWSPSLYIPLVALSGILWSGGFLTFAIHFGPMIVRPRAS